MALAKTKEYYIEKGRQMAIVGAEYPSAGTSWQEKAVADGYYEEVDRALKIPEPHMPDVDDAAFPPAVVEHIRILHAQAFDLESCSALRSHRLLLKAGQLTEKWASRTAME